MRKVCLLILIIPVLGLAQESRKEDAWSPFMFFIGTWKGTGKGEPGVSQLERQYQFVLDGKYVEVKHKSVNVAEQSTSFRQALVRQASPDQRIEKATHRGLVSFCHNEAGAGFVITCGAVILNFMIRVQSTKGNRFQK